MLGGVTQSELEQLAASVDRVGFVYAQIVHLCNQRRADGGLGADAPVLSRYYQLISDGMLGYRQARKIEDIPFPWPYTQAVSSFLVIFVATFPIVLAHFANCGADRTCDQPTWWLGPCIAFITSTSYVTLQQVARALEDPFVHPPNDLPANALQAAFNGRLLTTWDAIRCPADTLVASSPASSGPPPSLQVPTVAEHNGSSGTLEREEHWGEYADLEDADVRRACADLLQEWRAYGKNASVKRFEGKGHVSTPKIVRMARPTVSGFNRLESAARDVASAARDRLTPDVLLQSGTPSSSAALMRGKPGSTPGVCSSTSSGNSRSGEVSLRDDPL